MTIEDNDLLNEFRAKRFCEFCGARLRYAAEPHHVRPKGMGGGSRLDIPFNLIALGGPWDCACHTKAENGGHPDYHDCVAIIARREGTKVAAVKEEVWRLLRETRK